MAVPRRRLALVASDNLDHAAVYWALLLDLGYDVQVARDGDEARQLVQRHGVPELLVADVWLPKADGVNLVRHLRRDTPKHRMGVIMFSAHEVLRELARRQMMLLGIARVLSAEADRTAIREAIQTAQPPPPASSGASERDQTADDLETLKRMAVTDELTGLSNRHGGKQLIDIENKRAIRHRTPLSCILFDIDRFRDVNNTYGHPAGDRVLRELSDVLRQQVRGYDILVRWGGEEILVVLAGDLEQARQLAERVRHAVETHTIKGIHPVTVSGGVATNDIDYDFESMWAQADRRLLQAKKDGRNRIDWLTP
jgi:diguanylate cyclase (GGDEF)-like protein